MHIIAALIQDVAMARNKLIALIENIDELTAMQLGADDFLTNPLEFNILKEKLKTKS